MASRIDVVAVVTTATTTTVVVHWRDHDHRGRSLAAFASLPQPESSDADHTAMSEAANKTIGEAAFCHHTI